MNVEKKNVGIIGASGYGGNELVRLVLGHPNFKLAYVAADSNAGKKLSDMLPWIEEKDDLEIEKWSPDARTEPLQNLDLVFISLPTGMSKRAEQEIPDRTKIVDLGGDHRFVEGWTYGLADIWPDHIRGSKRVANPGCYPAAALTALAPLVCFPLTNVIIDAQSGISGAGRGGGGGMAYAEVNEDLSAYKLFVHDHTAEIGRALSAIRMLADFEIPVTFTPHLVPMPRGILATCYLTGTHSTEGCFELAREYYKNSPFVRVTEKSPHSKWTTGSNLAFVSYASNGKTIIAIGAIDNLVKGAAGQAVQNANLMFDFEVTAGLEAMPLWP